MTVVSVILEGKFTFMLNFRHENLDTVRFPERTQSYASQSDQPKSARRLYRLAENRSAVVLSVRFALDVEQVVRDVR